jgi:hypothetical protein
VLLNEIYEAALDKYMKVKKPIKKKRKKHHKKNKKKQYYTEHELGKLDTIS